MHILLIADGRSAITRNWLHMLNGLDHEVSLVSTYPCEPPHGAELMGVFPVAFSSLAGGQVKIHQRPSTLNHGPDWKRKLLNTFRPLLLTMRSYFAPLGLGKFQKQLAALVDKTQPDLVHVLRIPFEGMLTTALPDGLPVVVSIWGNDLTLHARSSFFMSARTRQTLDRADGLLADASRDIRLAAQWGFKAGAPSLVVPGSGGLDLEHIRQVLKHAQSFKDFDIPTDRAVIVNPRGFRPGSVHQDTFFKSIPLVLRQRADAFFVCCGMQAQPQAEKWVRNLHLEKHVLLLPYLPQEQLWQLFGQALIYVSLSSHDGTPNTLLESLACGCFPVAGDIESLREWITSGVNGMLVDPHDPQQAADALLQALSDDRMRLTASRHNLSLVSERADMMNVRKLMQGFYQQVLALPRS